MSHRISLVIIMIFSINSIRLAWSGLLVHQAVPGTISVNRIGHSLIGRVMPTTSLTSFQACPPQPSIHRLSSTFVCPPYCKALGTVISKGSSDESWPMNMPESVFVTPWRQAAFGERLPKTCYRGPDKDSCEIQNGLYVQQSEQQLRPIRSTRPISTKDQTLLNKMETTV